MRGEEAAGTAVTTARRPLVGLAFCLGVGVAAGGLLARAGNVRLTAATAATAAVAAIVTGLRNRGRAGRVMPWLVVLLAGTLLGLGEAAGTATLPPRFASGSRGEAVRVDVEGVVASDPGAWPDGPCRLRMRVERLREAEGAWEPVRGAPVDVILYANAPRRRGASPAYGQRWRLRGRLRQGVSPRAWRFTGHAAAARRLPGGSAPSWRRLCYAARAAGAELLQRGLESGTPSVGVMQALILGYRQRVDSEWRALFAATGTLHLFAISGLHVGIAAGLLAFMLRLLGVQRARWIYVMGPLLGAYVVATGGRPSAARACTMALAYAAAPALGRRSDALSALALAFMLALAWAPGQIGDAGLTFSFGVAFALLTVYPVLFHAWTGRLDAAAVPRRWWTADPLQAGADAAAWNWLRCGARWTVAAVCLSCSAWLASAPLTARYFGRCVPVGLVANVVMVPLGCLMVLSGCLAVVLGSAVGVMAEIFNHASWVLVGVSMVIVRLLSRLPGGGFDVPRPSWAAVMLGYAALASGTYVLWRHARRKGWT